MKDFKCRENLFLTPIIQYDKNLAVIVVTDEKEVLVMSENGEKVQKWYIGVVSVN